ncbi:SslE/AcfD family lipoprotein zinc metalloprotease [Ferrimonas balearica]|uniref:SslE/AcfD family lipoprotein zinc metalloprotease n=1 Tax=Ferrimonas balearica TaxID=44012 RepID=UPI001C93F6D6|nr:SslE/AcfD family lipoprotein zinc metalloprotease [Ferrimonas balearica]MBY5979170.1 SslE/AcfD family lipoprotein zinc metalloprotease [Ferrimonas balearica]
MKKSLLSLTLLSLLAGCGGSSSGGTTPEIPEPELPTTLRATFTLDGTLRFAEPVRCNGKPAIDFEITVGDSVSCHYKGTILASFTDVQPDPAALTGTTTVKKTLVLGHSNDFVERPHAATNATALVRSYGVTHGDTITLSLTALQDLKFKDTFLNQLDLTPEAFAELLAQQANDSQTDKLPSTHVPDIEAAVNPNASPDLNAGFVAADAESGYQYQPEQTILASGRLTDSDGKPVAGVAYFSRASRGVTDAEGKFEFVWGDTVRFGLDTFELGQVRGNQQQVSLTELGEGDVGLNIDALVRRYADDQLDHWQLPERVTEVFAAYPNVINEIISLSLSSQPRELALGDGQVQWLPAEFAAQFDSGLAADIDQQLCQRGCEGDAVMTRGAVDDSGQILADIQRLWGSSADAQQQGWKPVSRFHVFHDSTNFYGSTGHARGQAAVNIANSAFPVMMARNDNNYWIPFGAPKAWDQHGLAYITEAPSTVVPERVGGETATFNLPFVSMGEIGQGKVMVMGNARYHSILVCPNGYSWQGGVDAEGQCRQSGDSDDMKHFFHNALRYLTGQSGGFSVGTNVPYAYFKRGGQVAGEKVPFALDSAFGVTTEQLQRFDDLDPNQYPLLILNGFEYLIDPNGNHYDLPLRADLERPKLSQDDATALIDYVSRGGSILVMETVLEGEKAGALARLLDSAGIAFGMNGSVVADGNGPSAGYPDRVRNQRGHGIWVLERYAAVEGDNGPTLPYRIENGQVVWLYQEQNKPDDKPKLEVAKWTETGADGQPVTHVAFIDERESQDVAADKARILAAFTREDGSPAYQECRDPNYHYEVNCLEYRPGNDIDVTGGMFVPRYTELDLGDAQARAMVKAADLGTSIERLYQHERYFRSEGKQGQRLSSVDLNRLYQNLSVWLWNDLDYRYDDTLDDELGFERFTQFLNCYSDDRAGGGTRCPAELRAELVAQGMVWGDEAGEYAGQLNPDYPLNYMEKPLTRLMLGRSFWDLDIVVDVRRFPGEAQGSEGGTVVALEPNATTTAWYAGNRQPTGQWAVAHQPFTVAVSGTDAPVTVTIALADDLTGREKHELGLRRPPRMQQSFTLNAGELGSSHTLTVPYGGLIYVQGRAGESGQVSLSGTVDAPLYQLGKGWVNPQNASAPIGEVVSRSFVYTAPKANLAASNYGGSPQAFAEQLDQFAADLNDFYARDEGAEGQANRMATDPARPANRHHFVNDVAISIGAAHSGYPVMNSSFNVDSSAIGLAPLNSWLLWHEVGHNAAEAPFNVAGATEVVNNLLALYMQDKHLGKMARVEQDIRIAPDFVKAEHRRAWAVGGAGERLVMFAQLKEWAETEFDVRHWYGDGELPAFYRTEPGLAGWNLFKLMHRLSRNAVDPAMLLPGENLCYGQDLGQSDQLMLCASYAAQTDLSAFFDAWNPGSQAMIYPGDSTPQIEGGISQAGLNRVAQLNLAKPERDPLRIDRISVH